MLQSGVENFFDTVKLGAPHFLHLLEATVNAVEATVGIVEPGIHMGKEFPQARVYIAQASVTFERIEADQRPSASWAPDAPGRIATVAARLGVELPGTSIAGLSLRKTPRSAERGSTTFSRCAA